VRVLLVNAATFGSHLKAVPLGLLYIISNCARRGVDFDFLDGALFAERRALHDEIMRRDFDVIGVSAMTHNFPEALRIADLVHTHRPRTHVVIGGSHASTVPAAAARQAPGSLVVAGEGEVAFARLLDALEGGGDLARVPGLCRAGAGGVECNPPELVEDLDSLETPAWDRVRLEDYTEGAHGLYFKRRPFAPLVTSRGCPFHCSFCAKSALTGETWRARSPENVLDEIQMLTREYAVREIHFEDDNIALDEGRLVEICRGLTDRGIDVTWKCPHGIYASHLDESTFELMARSGCYSLSFGIESGNREILARAGKKSTPEETARAVRAARRAGIRCVGFFIFGLEGETPRTVRETIDFAKSLPLDAAQFNLCVPFMGTPIRERYLELGYIADGRLEAFDVDHAVVSLPGLAARQLKRLRLRAFLEFYSRPRVFVANLRNLSSPEAARALFRRLRNIWRA